MEKILTIESDEEKKILRAISSPINSIEEEGELIELLKNHFNENESSLGVSAPQLGINKMAFAMANPRNLGEITICINPEIVKFYENKVGYYNETCLSIPGKKGLTKRYKMLKVTYYDENGVKIKRLLRDLEAIVFQHKLDHLFGVLMTDKDPKLTAREGDINGKL